MQMLLSTFDLVSRSARRSEFVFRVNDRSRYAKYLPSSTTPEPWCGTPRNAIPFNSAEEFVVFPVVSNN